MKRIAFYLLFVFALSVFLNPLNPAGFSQEGVGIDALSKSLSDADSLSNHFGLTVTSDGKLIPKPGPVFTVGDEPGVLLPYLFSNPKPIAYPRWAIRQGWEGKLVLAVEILPNGSVGRTQVMQSSGYRLLDKTADKAIQKWKFHPATKDGKPVLTCIQIPVVFKLEDN